MIDVTAEERAVFIGERLFELKVFQASFIPSINYEIMIDGKPKSFAYMESYPLEPNPYLSWLHSPNGMHEVKTAMIERGYQYVIRGCIMQPFDNSYSYDALFQKEFSRYRAESTTESEAVLGAAYKALMAEGE